MTPTDLCVWKGIHGARMVRLTGKVNDQSASPATDCEPRTCYTEGKDAAFLDLDVANDRARFTLLDAAKATASVACRKHRTFIGRMLNKSIAKPITP
jgi:hypothetical protein